MKKFYLNICSLGDPTSPKTWSGTPYNLYTELKKNECLGIGFSSMAFSNRIFQKILDLGQKGYYICSCDTSRGRITRYLNSIRVITETNRSSTNLTLHTGTLDLPFIRLPKNQKHYLYCDSTWRLWSFHSTNMKGYSKRLFIDAEKLEKKAYHQMDHLFTISKYVKDDLVKYYDVNPHNITVVGTGLGVITPYYGKKDYSKRKILFAAKGRFEDKGGKLVIEAFKKASSVMPDLELIIVGQNEYTLKIKEPNIKTYGFLPVEDLQNLFNDSSIFLMPAINEPWGLVYLEALACKMPIIGLNRNSFPEISANGAYGFGLDDADPDKLTDILINAFSNYKKLEEMGNNGQEFCLKNFSWSNTVAKIINTIETLNK